MILADITSKYRGKLIILSYKDFLIKGKKVLDIGCGNGVVSSQLANFFGIKLTGCDVDNYLARNIRFKRMQKNDLIPFKENSFDIAMFNDVLHHTKRENQTKLILEALRVSKQVLIFELKPTLFGTFFDFLINKFHHLKMNIPFTYQTEEQWTSLFKKLGVKYKTREVTRPFFYPFSHIAFSLSY